MTTTIRKQNFSSSNCSKNHDLFYTLDYTLDLIQHYLSTLKALKLMGTDIELKEMATAIHGSYWEAAIFFVEEVQVQCEKLGTTLRTLKNQEHTEVILL